MSRALLFMVCLLGCQPGDGVRGDPVTQDHFEVGPDAATATLTITPRPYRDTASCVVSLVVFDTDLEHIGALGWSRIGSVCDCTADEARLIVETYRFPHRLGKCKGP